MQSTDSGNHEDTNCNTNPGSAKGTTTSTSVYKTSPPHYSDDTDAAWVVRPRKIVYGFNVHHLVGINRLILSGYVTPANVADTVELKKLVEQSKIESGMVVADKGYASEKNRRQG